VASSSRIQADHPIRRRQSSHCRRASRYTSEKIITGILAGQPNRVAITRAAVIDVGPRFWRPPGAESMSTTSPTGDRDDHTQIIGTGHGAVSIIVLFVLLGMLRRVAGGCVEGWGLPWLTTAWVIML
jgi:hypothetical protein